MDRPAPPRPQSSGRISWLLAALSLAVVGAIAATQLPLSLLTGDSEEITRERVEAGFDRAFSSFESKLALQELKQGFPDEYAEMLRTMVDLRLSHAPTLTPEELAQEEAVLRNWLRDFYLRNQRYVPDAPALELLALWRSDLDALIQLQRVSDFQCAGRVRGKLHLDVSPAKETLELLDRAAAARIVAMRAGRDKPFGQSEFGVSDLKEINSGLRARSATEEFINAFTLGGTDELGGAELCDGMVKLYRTVAEAPASKAARWARFIEGMAGPPRPAK